jgi:hypothetical protein
MTELPDPTPGSDTPKPAAPAATTPAAPAAAAPNEATLREAYKAFKKRLKIKQLDHDSRYGRAPTSSGSTEIAAIEPPNQYGREVWDALVTQGKLKYSGQGMYEIKR